MPKVKSVERRIFNIEGFDVTIKAKNNNGEWKDIRDDASLPKQYNASRMSRNSFSVTEWKSKFKKQYPGYEVDVLDNNGDPIDGHTKLSSVRDTYIPDDDSDN